MPDGFMLRNIADCDWENVNVGRKIAIRKKPLPLDIGSNEVTIEFSYLLVPDGYSIPRHRHNCDQIRYVIDGIQSIGTRQNMEPGECGYFPEGAYYGPQEQKGDCRCMLLQFQGPSGQRLLSSAALGATYKKMIEAGAVFENGVYRGRKQDGSPQNKDSYTAIWEEHEGRKLEFPKPRYRDPVMMLPERFDWLQHPSLTGIELKTLGRFTEFGTAIGFLRVAPGSTLVAEAQPDATIHYLLEGSVTHSGKAWPEGTFFSTGPGLPRESMNSPSGATFLSITLPIQAMARRRALKG